MYSLVRSGTQREFWGRVVSCVYIKITIVWANWYGFVETKYLYKHLLRFVMCELRISHGEYNNVNQYTNIVNYGGLSIVEILGKLVLLNLTYVFIFRLYFTIPIGIQPSTNKQWIVLTVWAKPNRSQFTV